MMRNRHFHIYHIVIFSIALGATAAFYSYTIFSNFCMDLDTLNWADSLKPLKDDMTFLNSIAIKGWFTKFHLLMFSLIYLITKVYSFWYPWDYLMGFKICTIICALLTVPLIFFICKNTMRHFSIMLVISFLPLYVLGYSWMITTCDDNVLANFFNLIFLISLLIATGAIKEKAHQRHCLRWAFITGIAAGLSMASHLKNIVSLPLILALVFVRPPLPRRRIRIAAVALLGLLLSFGLLYWLYWIQSTVEPVSSKLDFWVFHRVPGRFYLTPGRPALQDHLVFVLVGIRSSLYAFQELFIHTDLYDKDLLGFFVVGLFFVIYLACVFKTWNRRIIKILFALFVLHVGHSFLYDSWVVERWDYFTIPVFITMGIYWDSVMDREFSGLGVFQRARFSLLLLVFFSILVWANLWSTYKLIRITNNSMDYKPSAKRWPYYRKVFFYFDHRGLFELAGVLDQYLDEGAYFLSLRYMESSSSHVCGVLNQYLNLYCRNYRSRLITDVLTVGDLIEKGKLKKLLYLDTVKVPFYVGNAKTLVAFNPAMTKTVFQNNQIVLKEVTFR